MAEPLIVDKGTLHAYRMFDIADEIDLQKALALHKQAAERLKLSREGSQYLQMPDPPVAFHLGNRPVALDDGTHSAELIARLFDHGAVSMQLRIPIAPGTSLDDLVAVADDIYDNPGIDQLARTEAEKLCQSIAAAMKNPHFWDGSESYHVIFIQKFTTSPTAAEILERENLARLLLGETNPKPLSNNEHWDVTKQAFSYFADDLAVVDWNSAFVYEPSGSQDIPDILEIAAAQLLELRYYDEVLDDELDRIYEEMAVERGRLLYLFRSDYAELRRKVTVLMLDIAEFTERVENSLKIIGDFYLARVYRAALRRFRIPAWQESVDRKEALVGQVYGLMQNDLEQGRMVFLEAMIVVLILAEES